MAWSCEGGGGLELGRQTDGMPEQSGSSAGKRADKSVWAETWARTGNTSLFGIMFIELSLRLKSRQLLRAP